MMRTLPRSSAAPGGDADRPDTHARGCHAIAAAKRAYRRLLIVNGRPALITARNRAAIAVRRRILPNWRQGERRFVE